MPVIAALINARGWRTTLLWLAGLLALVVVPPYALVVRSRVRYAPAVTVARALTDTFAGIRPADALPFVAAQVVGASTATMLFRWLVPALPAMASDVIVPHVQAPAREEVKWTR